MAQTQAAGPHHQLSFGGMAPWPVPDMPTIKHVQADPAARCCRECGRRLLLLLLRSSSWVSHRSEHVTFRDDRSVVRRVIVEFHVPDLAPLFLGDDGQVHSLVPLSVMRRKTLVNFELRDDDGRSVAAPTLRQNQALTESVLLACADAVLGGAGAAGCEIAEFVHQVVSGDQAQLTAAFDSLDDETAAPAVLDLAETDMFRALLDRLADNFVQWVLVPVGPPRRRVLTFSCDEPLLLQYREPGLKNNEYEHGERLRPWRPVVWCSALGLMATRIRFPVPAAENTASFHFEIDAPKGTQITEASLLAGRPNQASPSFDHVQGGFPTVGLHVIEVPNGSSSRAQVGLQVVTRGWMMTTVLSCWVVFALMLAFATHPAALSQKSETPVLILVALASGVAGLIAQSDVHGVAAYLLKWARALATIAAGLPLVATIYVALESVRSASADPVLWAATGVSLVIAVILSTVCLLSWQRQRAVVLSPWEQKHDRGNVPRRPPRPASFPEAEAKYHYDRPAMRVDSAEGWHTRLDWNQAEEDTLIAALERHAGLHYPAADQGSLVGSGP
jgi:hypothetical protein